MHIALKLIAAVGLMVFTPFAAVAASFEDGVAAFDRADDVDALRIFTALAGLGDSKSQFALAEMYRQGRGVRQDYTSAFAWYRKAAGQANPGAEFNLGVLYQTGQGAPKSDRLAAQWYAKAAGQGYADAQVKLGVLYADGRGVPQDDTAARAWFQKAADQGDGEGRRYLARMVPNAYGAPRESVHAIMDRVFGAGRWRETSGYRSLAKEEELRRQGAGTVPAGRRSHHSLGGPNSPGAYDLVVIGMSPRRAAAKLTHASEQLSRVIAEGPHGGQGPHLHVEPRLARTPGATPKFAEGGAGHLRALSDPPGRLLAVATKSLASHD